MKLSHLLPLVAASSALVIPSESVLREIQYEEDGAREWFSQLTAQKDRILKDVKQEGASYVDEAKSQFDELRKFASFKAREGKSVAEEQAESFQDWMSELFDEGKDAVDDYRMKWEEFDVDDYLPDRENVEVNLESYKKHMQDLLATGEDKIEMGIFGHHHGHHGHDDDDDDDHHHHPHHPHHPGHGDDTKNYTIYQLIANSEYSTTLAKLISKYPSIVDRLNSTKANHTVFAPTDKAFSKIPSKVLDKFSKKEVEALLNYHIVPGNYPASRLLFTQTAPTYLYSDHLASKPQRQRLTFKKGLGGLSVNFYARVVAPNIIGLNGVVHGVNSPIFPPIGAIAEIDLFPATFSTLELALTKTGLLDELNSTDHAGGTLFAPDNWAFEKLGPRINAFLFSKAGNKYLKALLLYHVVPDNTLYSDAYYHADPEDDKDNDEHSKNLHVDLPTALEGKKLSVDISRWGPIVTIKVNGFNSVTVSDVPAEDGVIHVMTSVLIPPKTPKGLEIDGEMTVEELIERLEPLVDEEDRKFDL